MWGCRPAGRGAESNGAPCRLGTFRRARSKSPPITIRRLRRPFQLLDAWRDDLLVLDLAECPGERLPGPRQPQRPHDAASPRSPPASWVASPIASCAPASPAEDDDGCSSSLRMRITSHPSTRRVGRAVVVRQRPAGAGPHRAGRRSGRRRGARGLPSGRSADTATSSSDAPMYPAELPPHVPPGAPGASHDRPPRDSRVART